MKRVLIIGAGFGGLSALNRLSGNKKYVEVTVIDRKSSMDFLPELPSILGRNVREGHLACDIERLVKRSGARFMQREAAVIDRFKREVECSGERIKYDYLVIASGSETAFYGQDHIKRAAYKLDDVYDAAKLRKALDSGSFDSVVVAGGGYTGIEVATNIRLHCDKRKLNKRIYIIERAKAILGPLPQRLREYTVLNLLKMGIKTYLETTITDIKGTTIKLSNQETIDKALLIWAAGVKTGDIVDKLDVPKGAQGRIKVDEYLRAEEDIFVIGDAAEFIYHDRPLRMAVQFSIIQGDIAAKNIINSIRGLPLKKYVPVDLGYVVPMANNRSCGILFGKLYVGGVIATLLHYMMCLYSLPTIRRKVGLLWDVLRG